MEKFGLKAKNIVAAAHRVLARKCNCCKGE